MRAPLPLHILLLHTQVSRCAHTYRGYASFSDICGACFGCGSGFGIGFTPLLTRSSPSRHPPFTQYPSPSRSLVRDGQTSPHTPRLVVPHSTCPSLSPSPRTQLYNRSCSNKHTHQSKKDVSLKLLRTMTRMRSTVTGGGARPYQGPKKNNVFECFACFAVCSDVKTKHPS
jgi:hypothetical protein